MYWCIQRRDPLIGSVDGEGVLNEVIGSDREKVHFLRKCRGHERCGGDFDHHSDLDVRVIFDAGFGEFFHFFVEEIAC